MPHKVITSERFYYIMRNDLKSYFGYYGEVESRMVPVWYLVARSKSAKSKLKTKGGLPEYNGNNAGFSFRNMPIQRVISSIWGKFQGGPPFFDKTGIKCNIDIKIDALL